MNVSLTAFKEKVSKSRNRSRAVLSNTIIASASIARLLRNTSGNCISGWPWYSALPNSIPAKISKSTSGILSLFPTQLDTTPTNNRTAMPVVIISASCAMCLFFV